eukprot:TRINITY_DN6803_c0_g1_i1.p1 TRINITY_DN6803_c0_g1~~TRINITY_DN6803_c0_g1_i1.p1  ORF type:complete len:175 (-),score=18.79 TRINITY_DN6803_c0_g1_i1:20-544(-)
MSEEILKIISHPEISWYVSMGTGIGLFLIKKIISFLPFTSILSSLIPKLNIQIEILSINIPLSTLIATTCVVGGVFLKSSAKNVLPEDEEEINTTTLCNKGPYSFSRNPKIVGNGLIQMGLGFLLDSIFPFITLGAWFYYIHNYIVIKRETKLHQIFKNEYILYKKKTPRYLII